MTHLIIIDNYDSFTFNLVQFFGDLGASCTVMRNDALSAGEALERARVNKSSIILSPGPCTPKEAGICVELAAQAENVPILGVCLGHQAIAAAFGGEIIRAPQIMHGKISPIEHDGEGMFDALPSPLAATRYHSLMINPKTLPDCLTITARCDDVIMGISHVNRPVYGVQFHPESIATQAGHGLLANFLKVTG